MLDAAKVLSHPYAWEGLKRALKAGRVTIETLGQAYGWASATPMEPQPVELSVKVVLFGERMLYYLLKEYDAEFDELFKVAADFESQIERNADNVRDFACFLASVTRRHGLAAAGAGRGGAGRRTRRAPAETPSACRRAPPPSPRLYRPPTGLAGRAGHQHILRADVDAALRVRGAPRRAPARLPARGHPARHPAHRQRRRPRGPGERPGGGGPGGLPLRPTRCASPPRRASARAT